MGDCRTFWVATVHPSNRPCHAGVGVWVDDAFYFSTGRKSRKAPELRRSAPLHDDGEEAVIVEGGSKSGLCGTRTRGRRLHEEVQDGSPQHGQPDFCGASRAVFGFIEKSFPKSATRWRFEDDDGRFCQTAPFG
jgi:hypothetical protein